jgi:hypothetical protein
LTCNVSRAIVSDACEENPRFPFVLLETPDDYTRSVIL